LLRPGGSLFVAVPFLLKLHQVPYDFYRYSHHQLENIGHAAGLDVISIEGYYDPILLMRESTLNIHSYALPRKPFLPRKTAKILLEGLTWLLSGIRGIIGEGYVGDPSVTMWFTRPIKGKIADEECEADMDQCRSRHGYYLFSAK
jgi:hypothetical protein